PLDLLTAAFSTNSQLALLERAQIDKVVREQALASANGLQHFFLVPESRQPVAEKIPELRAAARDVAGWISNSPSVRDTYWVGDRIATHDELAHSVGEGLNIFMCKVNFGCFWQEKPEDCVALYRELMSSPVFSYLHDYFWS